MRSFFLVLLLSLAFGFNLTEAATIAIIGACDGPTAIFFSSKLAPHLLGAVSIAAYSYMSLIGIIQPIIIHLCTTEEERHIETENLKEEEISQTTKFFFPVVITIIICLFASMGTALVGSLMAGNFIKESGVVPGITKALQGSFLYLITFCLGVAIGGTMQAGTFFSAVTLITLGLGFVAICCDTVVGIYGGKVMRFFDKGISPVAAAAGLSAFPLGAQGSQKASALYNPTDTTKWVGSQAFTINTGGQIQSVLAAVILFSMVVGLVAKGIGM